MRAVLPTALSLLTLLSCAPAGVDTGAPSLDEIFNDAARDSDVPRDLLVAIGYTMSRLETPPEVTMEQGFGLMSLRENAVTGPSLESAAIRLGSDPFFLKRDAELNIHGAAAELSAQGRHWERESGLQLDSIDAWVDVVGWYSGSDDGMGQLSFAREVYSYIEGGLEVQAEDGSWLVIASRPLDIPLFGLSYRAATGDYSGNAQFIAAHSSNYSNSSRGSGDIDRVVVHTAQGPYSSVYNWFANSSANVSAHYVVRSSDGEVTQMLWEEDIGWHAGDSTTNRRSVGIELEGYIESPSKWYTDAQYGALAALISDVCDRNGIPKDRAHIIGHNEVPGCSSPNGGGASCHGDPGSGFDWDKLMGLLGTNSGNNSGNNNGNNNGGNVGTGSADLVGFVREGSIYNSDQPVSGAVVALSSGESTTTNSAGYYEILGAADGWVDITVTASGFGTEQHAKELRANNTNWRSVAVSASGSPQLGNYSPTGYDTVNGPQVTMRWDSTGADSYQVKVYFQKSNGSWAYYYDYSTGDVSKSFWPVVDDVYYAWSVREIQGSQVGEWSDPNYFFFNN